MTTTFDPVAALAAADAATKGQADPQSIVAAVKAASSPHEAVVNAQAVTAFGGTIKTFDRLRSLQPSAQAAAWHAMSSTEQDQLRAVGYHAPNLAALSHIGAGGEHGGVWSAIASGFHDFASAMGHGASDVLNVLGAPLRAVQHLYRASHALSEDALAKRYGWTYVVRKAESSGVTLNPSAFADFLNPSAWAQAWRQTQTGSTTLDPAIARSLNARYGKSQVQFALRVLHTGTTRVVNGIPQNLRPELVKQMQDPAFQSLVKQVEGGRMSLGRNLVGTKFLNDHPLAGKLISGGIDAAFDIAATPLNKAGEAAKAYRVGYWGLTDAEVGKYLAGDASQMDSLLASRGFDRWTRYAGQYLERGDYAGLARFDPRLDNIVPQLQSEGVASADAFKRWMAGESGMAAILSGQAARKTLGTALVPHLSMFGWLKADVKQALQHGIDTLADGKVATLDHVALGGADVSGAGAISQQGPRAETLAKLLRAGEAGAQHGRIPGVSNAARLVRRMTTLVQTRPYLDIGPEADVANFRRFLQGFLPARRVDDVLNVFVNGDLGTRYRIVQAAREQMFHTLGFYATPRGADAAEKLLGALDDLVRQQSYSVGGLDEILGDDQKVFHDAVLEPQLSTRLALPMPNETRRALRQSRLLASLHLDPIIAATRFMQLWKLLLLDRPGFAVRFALTENLLRLLRTGPRKFLGSYLAQGAGRTMTDEQIASEVGRIMAAEKLPETERDAVSASVQAKAVKPIFPYHPTERALALLAERIPEGMRPFVDTPAKFYGAVLGATTRKWARSAQAAGVKLLGLEDYITAATHLYTHQPVQDAFGDHLSMMRGTVGYVWTTGGVLKAVKDDAGAAVAALKDTAHYSESRSLGDPLWKTKWMFGLDQVAHSQLGRAVLESIDKPSRTQERAVLRVLNDPSFAERKAAFARASRLPDGRVVGIDATQHEADLAFSRVVVKHVNALLRADDPTSGPLLHDLVREMLATGRGPAEETIDAAIGKRQIPASVYGPDILQVHPSQNFFSKSWELLVGKPGNWLARQPQFIQAYGESLPAAREWAAHVMPANPDGAEQLASDLATQSAVNSILPYIHNPELRTQFEDAHRILFPFLFAQRQFLQRWGRLMQESPDGLRKIQLTMNGLRTTGFIRKDTNGTTYFYYPGSEYVQSLLTHVLSRLGVHVSVPLMVPFTGQVRYLMPGLSNPVMPNVGPFAAVGLKELAKLMPEFDGLTSKALQQGATDSLWQQFTPSVVNRVWSALSATQKGQELASTTMQAIKALDYAGYTLPNDPTPQETEQYVSRIRNWARSLLLVRAALGFVLPATPHATLDPQHLNRRLYQLLNELTYNKAVAEFIREHPTATAYTVFDTQTHTDGYTPATAATRTWLDAHKSFAEAHPLAAAWLMPRSGPGFTPASYREQIALGMRSYRTVSSTNPSTPGFLQEVVMSRGMNAYYTTLARYEKAYTATASSTEHQQLTHWWDTWKASFFKINPLISNYIASSASAIRRQKIIEDVQAAIETPEAPKTPAVPLLREMVGTYEQFVSDYTAQVGMYSSALTRFRKGLKASMVQWGDAYARSHPEVADFWNTIIKVSVWEQK